MDAETNAPNPIEEAQQKIADAIQNYQSVVGAEEVVTDWVILLSKTFVGDDSLVHRVVSTVAPANQDFVTNRGLMEICLQVEKQQISRT